MCRTLHRTAIVCRIPIQLVGNQGAGEQTIGVTVSLCHPVKKPRHMQCRRAKRGVTNVA